MDIAKIKFRRVRFDEYTVQHWFDAGTKHLGAVYATKHYYYDVYDANGKMLNSYRNDRTLFTLKDVKQWIADYDAIMDKYNADEAAKKEAARLESIAYRARMDSVVAEWKSPRVPMGVEVGQIIRAKMGTMSKPNSVGDAFIAYPSTDSAPVTETNVKIVHVANITNDEFDAAVTDLYSNFKKEWLVLAGDKEHEYGGGYIGGSQSDDPRLEGMDGSAVFGDPVLMQIYRETMVELVHAIVAPDRAVLYVNSEGYGYARYIGQRA